MDNIVDSLNTAYQELVTAATGVVVAKEVAVGTDGALENLKQKWKLFRVACDQAEELVLSVKLRIRSECLVDKATGTTAAHVPSSGLPPISAVQLEQMSKAVRWLVIEIQNGSGASAHHHVAR